MAWMDRQRDDFDRADAAAFLNHIYAVSVDPDRLFSLVERWEREITPKADHPAALSRELAAELTGDDTVVEALDKVISAHAARIGELLSGFRTAAFIFNKRGLIVASNDVAAAVFNIMPGHWLADLAIDPEGSEAIEGQLADLMSARVCKNAIVRFKQAGATHTVLAHLRAVDVESSGRHVIMVTSEHKWSDEITTLLAESYAVSARESEVLRGLTRGETVAAIAAATGRSEATVRTQVQSLLQKTQLGSQAELVRLATTLLHSASGHEFGTDPQRMRRDLPLYELTEHLLPDGRKIHYRIAGAPVGRPFLLLPSGQCFIRWTDAAEADMAKRKLRMIVPVRAGYGHSSQCPQTASIYDVAADDVRHLLKTLDVVRCPAVAICDDFKIALHLDKRHPGIVSAVIGAAATMPLETSAQFARLGKFVRFIQMNATYAPRTLPYASLLLFHMARRLGARRFLETMMSACPADVRALQNPAIGKPLEAGTEIALTQHFMAHQAWSREIIEFAKPWSRLLLDCETPIRLLAGIGDPFSPIETVREYKSKKPDLDVVEVPEAGQTLVYTHHGLVLDAVEAAMAAA